MGELLQLFTRERQMSPEHRASLIQELADIDQQLEPLERRAEIIRRALGLLDDKETEL